MCSGSSAFSDPAACAHSSDAGSCCSGRLAGALHAHPDAPGQFYYVVGSSILAVFEVSMQKDLGCCAADPRFSSSTSVCTSVCPVCYTTFLHRETPPNKCSCEVMMTKLQHLLCHLMALCWPRGKRVPTQMWLSGIPRTCHRSSGRIRRVNTPQQLHAHSMYCCCMTGACV